MNKISMNTLSLKLKSGKDNMSKLQTTSQNLVKIVEGIKVMDHGGWVDKHGDRLKDTQEWVEFYNEATSFFSGDIGDLIEYIEHKGLFDDFQLWANGPIPAKLLGDN